MSTVDAAGSTAPRKRVRAAALLGVVWAVLLAGVWVGTARWREGREAAPLTTAGTGRVLWSFSLQFEKVNAAGELVRFGELREDGEPTVRAAAVQVGERWLELPGEFEGGSFFELLVSRDGQRWLAFEQFSTEAPGDVSLLASDDGGRTFVHRATVPWPTYMASLDSVSFDGERVELVLSLDDEAQVSREYWTAWDAVRVKLGAVDSPTIAAGRYVLRSPNAGRSFEDLARAK